MANSRVARLVPTALDCNENSLEEPGCTQPVRGGQAILVNNSRLCTYGFSVASTVDAKRYMLTAGHCFAGLPIRGVPVSALNNVGTFGPFATSWNRSWVRGSSHDWGIAAINSGITYRGVVYVQATNDGSGRTTTRNENYLIYGVGGSVLYQVYCKTGASSGTSCGQVVALGVANVDDEGTVATNLAEVQQLGNRYVCHGDSGGPVYAGNRGYGMVQSIAIDTYVETAPNGNACYQFRFYVGLAAALNDMHVRLV